MLTRVLLINPNLLRPAVAPIALDYIADCLMDNGATPTLCDLCLASDPERELAAALAGRDYHLIAVSIRNTDDCYFASSVDFLPGFADLIASIRRRSPAPIVAGGSGYSVAPGAALLALGADFGIAGDGERSLPLLARSLAAQEDPFFIPGLVWRQAGKMRVNPPSSEPIHSLPRRRRFLDNARYFAEGGQAGVETKRGCDRGCIYCADPLGKGSRLRARTPRQVVEEFQALLSQNIDCFHLCDSEFNVPLSHASAVCEELSRSGLGGRARWYTYATPAGFSAELAQAMRRAGCVGVNFGADSADDRMLATLGRDYVSADLLATAQACRRAGLVFMFDLLLGGPGETRASLAHTIKLMKRISPHRVGVSLGVRIYPGTKLSKLVSQQGPLALNPNVQGAKEDVSLLRPVFYLAKELGEDAAEYVGGETALQVEHISRAGKLNDISFHVREGEVLGVWGRSGSGRTELIRAILGLDPIDQGQVSVRSQGLLKACRPRQLLKQVAYVTESRRDDGLFMSLSVSGNCSAPSLRKLTRGLFFKMNVAREKAEAKEIARKVSLVPPDIETKVEYLSGGNQQRVGLGKWLGRQPSLFIFDEPTRGVDVGAKMEIQSIIRSLAKEGKTILVVTSEVEEMEAIADRVVMLHDGKLLAELQRSEISASRHSSSHG